MPPAEQCHQPMWPTPVADATRMMPPHDAWGVTESTRPEAIGRQQSLMPPPHATCHRPTPDATLGIWCLKSQWHFMQPSSLHRSLAAWRNSSASDSRSEGWELKSLCCHTICFISLTALYMLECRCHRRPTSPDASRRRRICRHRRRRRRPTPPERSPPPANSTMTPILRP